MLYRQVVDLVTCRPVTPEAWGGFLATIVHEWVTLDVGDVFIQRFDIYLGALLGLRTAIVRRVLPDEACRHLHS